MHGVLDGFNMPVTLDNESKTVASRLQILGMCSGAGTYLAHPSIVQILITGNTECGLKLRMRC